MQQEVQDSDQDYDYQNYQGPFLKAKNSHNQFLINYFMTERRFVLMNHKNGKKLSEKMSSIVQNILKYPLPIVKHEQITSLQDVDDIWAFLINALVDKKYQGYTNISQQQSEQMFLQASNEDYFESLFQDQQNEQQKNQQNQIFEGDYTFQEKNKIQNQQYIDVNQKQNISIKNEEMENEN